MSVVALFVLHRCITATRAQTPHQTLLVDIDPRQTFDAVLHVHNVTPIHGAADQVGR